MRRRRHRCDVLHLQIAESQSPAASRRTIALGAADLHCLTRNAASRRLRPEFHPIHAPQENRFQFTDTEIKKLEDPKVKAFFLVNPGNPTGVALSKETISRLVI